MRWKFGNKNIFPVKSFYEKLLVKAEKVFHVKSIWIPKVPRKVYLFTLLAARAVILTAENLLKRKVVCISWCYLRKEANHLLPHCNLLYCSLALRLWWNMFSWSCMSLGDANPAKDLCFPGKLEEAGGRAGMECYSSGFAVDHLEREK